MKSEEIQKEIEAKQIRLENLRADVSRVTGELEAAQAAQGQAVANDSSEKELTDARFKVRKLADESEALKNAVVVVEGQLHGLGNDHAAAAALELKAAKTQAAKELETDPVPMAARYLEFLKQAKELADEWAAYNLKTNEKSVFVHGPAWGNRAQGLLWAALPDDLTQGEKGFFAPLQLLLIEKDARERAAQRAAK